MPLPPLPSLAHPLAGLLGLLVGLPLGTLLGNLAERFSYDDEWFDPGRGPRDFDHVRLRELEDPSGLPLSERLPFVGLFVGMLRCCRFGLARGPSRCHDCSRPFPPRSRWMPLAFLTLGGRCPRCATPLPPEHLAYQLGTPLLLGLVGAVHGFSTPGLLLGILAGLGLVASIVDLQYQIIPDEVPTAAMAIGLGASAALTAGALLAGAPLPSSAEALLTSPPLAAPFHLGWALAGSLAGGLALWALSRVGGALAGTGAMGDGDIKLAAALGLFLGPRGALISLFYAAVFGALAGLVVLAAGRGKREGGFTKFAFGPYICLGALFVALLGADAALGLYLGANERMVLWLAGLEPLR